MLRYINKSLCISTKSIKVHVFLDLDVVRKLLNGWSTNNSKFKNCFNIMLIVDIFALYTQNCTKFSAQSPNM